MYIQTVDNLKQMLIDSLKMLENVDGSLPVTGVSRIDIKVNNEDGFDVNFEGETDKTPNFVNVDVRLSYDD